MFDVIQNRRVLFGNGKTALIPELFREVTDKKILILAFSETAKCVADILSLVRDAGIEYILDTSLHSEPSTLDIDRIAAKADGCGAVLAIGGGSVLDCAKAVAMLATNGGTVVDYQMYGKRFVKI